MDPKTHTSCQSAGLDPATIEKLFELLVSLGGFFGPYIKNFLEKWLHEHFGN